MVTKRIIRNQKRKARQNLSQTEVERLSLQIVEIFFSYFDLGNIHNLHIYLPKKGSNEVDTNPLLARLWQQYPLIKTFIPVVQDGSTMSSVQITNLNGLRENKFGILEPKITKSTCLPNDLDMVIVPLIAFDKQCNRIGYGKGYYDRFLSQTSENCLKIGFAYELSKIDSIPVDKFDVKLDYIVTETRIYQTRGK